MSKTNLTTRVVLAEDKEKLQKQLQKALASIDERILELNGNASKTSFKTSGSFKYNELDGNTVNIHTSGDLVYLIKSLALMQRIKDEYDTAAISAGLITYPVCTWLGTHVESWIHDLQIRVKIVGNGALIAQLTTERRKLESFLTEDQRLATTLNNLSKLLKQ